MPNVWLDCVGFKRQFERVDQRRDGTYVMSDEEAMPVVALLEAHAQNCLRCLFRMEMLAPERRAL